MTRRAAQYVRMSTDKQDYSTLNQEAAIAAYAAARSLKIVRKYADEARSGLHFNSRPALKSLLADVLTRRADFGLMQLRSRTQGPCTVRATLYEASLMFSKIPHPWRRQ
nr:recombinase family protein [Bradyrhizobium macuxiense]